MLRKADIQLLFLGYHSSFPEKSSNTANKVRRELSSALDMNFEHVYKDSPMKISILFKVHYNGSFQPVAHVRLL
jgi:hypothetical protein